LCATAPAVRPSAAANSIVECSSLLVMSQISSSADHACVAGDRPAGGWTESVDASRSCSHMLSPASLAAATGR
jgi:hypothetical protein